MILGDYKKTYIDVDELQRLLGEIDYQMFFNCVQGMVEEGVLEATKNGKDTNGRYPPLAKKYRIIRSEQKIDCEDEIRRVFPLNYDTDYYLKHPKEYEQDRQSIMMLCRYHIREDKPLGLIMSINERSFDITGEEKWLVSQEGGRILRNLGLTESYLNIYRTPEPFIYFARKSKQNGTYSPANILIIENKDTWYTMRRLAAQGVGPFNVLIYGEGKKIIKSIEEIHLHDDPFLTDTESNFLYFGDLDDEGLGILRDLKRKFPRIQPWMVGYLYLIEEALNKNRWREGQAQRNIGVMAIAELLTGIGIDVSEKLAELFSLNRYMPQEAMNYQVLRRLWT